MASNVETYLKELRDELAGADPALVQDALYDAEEHLLAELAAAQGKAEDAAFYPNEAFNSIVERYGTPKEVAAAYLSAGAGAGAGASGLARASGQGPVGSALAPTAGRTGMASPGQGFGTGADESQGGGEGRATGSPTLVGGRAVTAGDASGQTERPMRRGLAARFFGVVVDHRAYSALLYMLLSLATGVFYFTVVVTGISLAGGLLVLIIGLPVALVFLALVRALSLGEGRIVESLLGVRMPRRSRSEPLISGLWARIRFWLKDRRTWTAMLYMVLQLPLGTLYFSLAVTGLAVGLWLVAVPFVQLLTGHTYANIGSSELVISGWVMPISVVAGALVLVLMLHLIRAVGKGHGNYAKAMLVRLDQ